MVINAIEESGEARISARPELGEWVGRIRCVNTRIGLRQRPFATRTGRSPAVTIARTHPLSHQRHAMQYVTHSAGG
jgi:hypothetical protein